MKAQDAEKRIDDLLDTLPEFSYKICKKLREIIHKADPKIVEDWKWGSNFNHNGMVCGFGAFKGWVHFVFFQGVLMKDPYILFNYGDHNLHNRSIKFTDISEIDEKKLIEYIKEAVDNNLKGKKVVVPRGKRKETEIPDNIIKIFEKENLFDKFNSRPFYQRRDYINWINDARQEETRMKRTKQMIEELKEGKIYMKMPLKKQS